MFKFILVKLAFVAPKNADTKRIIAVESVIYCCSLFSSFKPNDNTKKHSYIGDRLCVRAMSLSCAISSLFGGYVKFTILLLDVYYYIFVIVLKSNTSAVTLQLLNHFLNCI